MSDLGINTQQSATRVPTLVTPKGKNIYSETFDKAMKDSKLDNGFNKLMQHTEIEGYSTTDKTQR